ncbi:type II secretion system F family protein [Actinoplanes sp. NPDC049596]|uniref:type II secretion system F family protein n=1 Tax=unclassified Actinoplanes TaxID=2626549 RepID=UPI0034292A2B
MIPAFVIAVAAASAATFLLAYAALVAAFGRTPIQRRLASLQHFTVRREAEKEVWWRRVVQATGLRVERSELLSRFAERSAPLLDRLGATTRPAEWLAIRLLVCAVAAVLLSVLFSPGAGVPLGLLAGFFGSNALLRSRIKRREQAFSDELPGALQLMISSLRSGFTLHQSVEAAVRDDAGPVAAELRRALSETRISGSFEDALERIGERTRSDEMLWLVMALRLQREVGGSLVDVMQTTADTMRERSYLRRHVRALSGEGRMSAYVLTAMPIGTGLVLYLTNPAYLNPLFTEPLGWAMLAIGIIAITVGAIWLRVVVQVKA